MSVNLTASDGALVGSEVLSLQFVVWTQWQQVLSLHITGRMPMYQYSVYVIVGRVPIICLQKGRPRTNTMFA